MKTGTHLMSNRTITSNLIIHKLFNKKSQKNVKKKFKQKKLKTDLYFLI